MPARRSRCRDPWCWPGSAARGTPARPDSRPRARTDLQRYFGISRPPGDLPFTGSRFEHLAGGGDRPEIADTVTAEDLIAVQTLSVRIPEQFVLDILEGHLGSQMSALLRSIPIDMDMAEADAAHLRARSPADLAWHLLGKQRGIAWVKAGKILARKRPRLLPVYDTVVRCTLGRPRGFWLALHAALRDDDARLHRELLTLRQAAGLPETVSALRVCDVVLWMQHRGEHPNCRARSLDI
ncbi:DUF6308 family protein [Streptomyces sp. H10-C2]|uniref:DUF6308 family protein n=1 Tax=unclassified Streptomyces TaxID=2593676 RepID=UPI0024BBE1E5|nr:MULTISPECIES: DUF6308 family protein [unclassified Streptomyces]MDJ0345162.1 DUF6308 family protein [Streptomyces sp. PH10-H1]MDJ0374130.1 DUF6308 family protein [Streptomyces sp. H10-C2]